MALMNWATTRVTMVVTISLQTCKSAYKILKDVPSSDWRLQFVFMKVESLVIVDQQRHGEYVLEICTHRPSRFENLFDIKF